MSKTNKMSKGDNKGDGKKVLSIEEQYTKKSLHKHIYDLPDTQIGSIEGDTINMFVYDDDENKITQKDKFIVMGLYKIVDEIIVNAADNTVRDTLEIYFENNG